MIGEKVFFYEHALHIETIREIPQKVVVQP